MTSNVPTLYTQSLLKVEMTVVVTLAERKQRVGQILEWAPGSIIHFEKSCDEMLELEVSGQPIAEGECVKVGDKFGLRINRLILPSEDFRSLADIDRKPG